MEQSFLISNFDSICFYWSLIAIVTFCLLQFIVAPFGRHSSNSWGPVVPNKLGWIVFELVSLISFSLSFYAFNGDTFQSLIDQNLPKLILVSAWIVHYVHRAIIYPLMTKTSQHKMPLFVCVCAIGFNSVNGLLNGSLIGFDSDSDSFKTQALFDVRFQLGLILFCLGMLFNLRYDYHLISLRENETGNGKRRYKIPRLELFQLVSCANYTAELVEWCGFLLMSRNVAALSFLLWTAANLIPRAMAHHKFYHTKFDDYPIERRAIIPFLY
jgi:3-oxo-5-alpha-steroid 4-dehydrogenase 1